MKPRKLLTLLPLVLLLGACSLQGETGPVGPKGDTGEVGPAGPKGDDGKSIVQIIKTSTEGNVDTYTIVYSDSSTTTFTVTNGKNGNDGHSPEITINEDGYWCVDGKPTTIIAKGDRGDSIADVTYTHDEDGNTIVKITLSNGEERYVTILKGDKGDPGVSVESIKLTSSEGNKDTYTITYSNGLTSTFVVTNGVDGSQGIQGEPGKDGHTPVISIGENGNWLVDGFDTGIKAQGPKGDKGDKGDDAITYIPCIFKNYDGTKLYEFYYEKGSDIVYDGPTPVKTTIDDDGTTLNWTFTGWDKSLENIQKPTIFTAQFELFRYECTFVNYDGTVLEKKNVYRGESVTYTGQTPTRPSEVSGDQTIEWKFVGWDKKLDNIENDTIFTARYDAPNAIKLTFNNYDGSYLYTQYCGLNANVTYQGPKPTKPDLDSEDGIITKYEFLEFDKSLRGVKENTTFTATFSETPYYRCRFFDNDGTLLYTTSTFAGGQVSYDGKTPTKEQEVDGTRITNYAFAGWDKSISNITGPTDFHPNFYNYEFTGYKVTFMDSDNKEVLYSHYFEENLPARYPYETPWSYDDENVTMFFGWSESLSSITKETTVHMNMKTLSREQNGEYPQTRITDEDLLAKLNSIDKTGIDLKSQYLELDGNRYKAVDVEYGHSDTPRYFYYLVEPIKWRYLGQDDNSVLLLSEKILDARRYNEFFEGKNSDGFYANNYKEGEIRKWLNDDFLKETFVDQSLVKTTAVDNSVSSTGSDTNPYVCETTNDKIFLLSYKEVTNYGYGFGNDDSYDKSKVAYATDYAKLGVEVGASNGASNWWLRSPSDSGYGSYYAKYVTRAGAIHNSHVYPGNIGIRPALRFSL